MIGNWKLEKICIQYLTQGCNCKYHIVFAPKYKIKVIYGKIRVDIGKILKLLCERKGIHMVEAECCPNHIHMFVEITSKYSVSQIVDYLRGKSSLMIFDKHANLKYKYGSRHFGADIILLIQ